MCVPSLAPKPQNSLCASFRHTGSAQVVGKLQHQRSAASNMADQGCSRPARWRRTGWVQRMNNSLPCAQTLCCETNIQQHLCAWRRKRGKKKGSSPQGEPQPSIAPTVLSPNCQKRKNLPPWAGMTDSSRENRVQCALLLVGQDRESSGA